ncbi:MAG: glycosyltransferase family A protein [Aquabacterium sp.]
MSSPTIAVVIPTYKRPDLLRRCLDALSRQNIAPTSYEVIVVDDGRSADTREVVEWFNRRCQGAPAFRYLQPDGTRGPAAARNRGWRASEAKLIAFTDDDTVPAPDWLAEGCRAMSRDVVAVGGRVVVPTTATPTDHERNTQGLEAAEFATANAFAWREALEIVGGFDERFTRAWREDSDLHFTLLQRCGPVGWAPLAVVTHPVRKVPWGFSLQTQANVFFDALLFKKHPNLYRLKIRPHPPWRYYVIVGCTLLALFTALLDMDGLAAVLVIAAVIGVLDFFLLRLRGTAHTASHVMEMAVTSLAIPFLSVYWRARGALHFKVPFL